MSPGLMADMTAAMAGSGGGGQKRHPVAASPANAWGMGCCATSWGCPDRQGWVLAMHCSAAYIVHNRFAIQGSGCASQAGALVMPLPCCWMRLCCSSRRAWTMSGRWASAVMPWVSLQPGQLLRRLDRLTPANNRRRAASRHSPDQGRSSCAREGGGLGACTHRAVSRRPNGAGAAPCWPSLACKEYVDGLRAQAARERCHLKQLTALQRAGHTARTMSHNSATSRGAVSRGALVSQQAAGGFVENPSLNSLGSHPPWSLCCPAHSGPAPQKQPQCQDRQAGAADVHTASCVDQHRGVRGQQGRRLELQPGLTSSSVADCRELKCSRALLDALRGALPQGGLAAHEALCDAQKLPAARCWIRDMRATMQRAAQPLEAA